MAENWVRGGRFQEPSAHEGSELEAQHRPTASDAGLKVGAVVLALAMVAGLGVIYGWRQHHIAQELASSRAELSSSLAQVRSQAETLAARVKALSDEQAQQAAVRAAEEAAKSEATTRQTAAAHRAATRRRSADDQRWGQMEQKLSEQQKELAASQQQIAETQANLQQAKSELEGNLQSTRNELGSGIARTHEELVVLERKGERNYFEFDIEKSKSYHHAGPISISLRKANAKHDYCDLEILVDDNELSKKHVNLYEPAMFYPEGYAQPLELVINRVGQDSIHGYVSEPKYRPTVKAATEPLPATTTAAATSGAAPDPKLEHRPDGGH